MLCKLTINQHAVERLKTRFGENKSWLFEELDNGRFVWLKGSGDCGYNKNVRSGHLLYLPNLDEYCIVIMDDRSRLAITVLTEAMALKSPWGKGLDDRTKLRAKIIALGKEMVCNSQFIHLYAQERGELRVTVTARTLLIDWNVITFSLYKTSIKPEQIDVDNNLCTLSDNQMIEVSKLLNEKKQAKEILPYCELSISTSNGKNILLSNELVSMGSLDEAELVRRWIDEGECQPGGITPPCMRLRTGRFI